MRATVIDRRYECPMHLRLEAVAEEEIHPARLSAAGR
jgi:hypothetical protein